MGYIISEGNVWLSTAAAPAQLFLDSYPNSTFAYSLRKLRINYSGSAVRIREDGGNTESDIGFDGNGDFDVSAASSFIGANNGFIVTWYDQSGNGLDATQSVAGDQPSYSAAGFDLGPSIYLDGTNSLVTASMDLTDYITSTTIFAVLSQDQLKGNNTLYSWEPVDNSNRFQCHASFNGTLYFDFGDVSANGRISVAAPGGWMDYGENFPHILELYRDTDDSQGITVDGTNLISGTRTKDLTSDTGGLYVGAASDDTTYSHMGYFSEIICWGTDLGDTNRTSARSDINAYYAVY